MASTKPAPDIVEAEKWLNYGTDELRAALVRAGSRAGAIEDHMRRFQTLHQMGETLAGPAVVSAEDLCRVVCGSRITPPALRPGEEVLVVTSLDDQSAEDRQRDWLWFDSWVKGEAAYYGHIIQEAVRERHIGRCQGYRNGKRCNRLIILSPTGRPRKYCDDNTCGTGARRRNPAK